MQLPVHFKFRCVGTPQELKNVYGGGYQLQIKFKIALEENHIDRKTR